MPRRNDVDYPKSLATDEYSEVPVNLRTYGRNRTYPGNWTAPDGSSWKFHLEMKSKYTEPQPIKKSLLNYLLATAWKNKPLHEETDHRKAENKTYRVSIHRIESAGTNYQI
jgi:hypothetical protein